VPLLIQDGCHSSQLGFVFVNYLTNASVYWSDFFVAYSGEWRKFPFNDQCSRSFKMAAILDLVSFGLFSDNGRSRLVIYIL
jgi:hypothetical protein